MRKKYLLLILITISQTLQSGIYRPVDKYTIDNGLSNSEITSIHLDKKGFLWVGTSDGLNCYDGYGFRNFLANPSDSSSIFSDNIKKIEEDSSGNIWCATNTGVSRYNWRLNNFSYFPLNDDPSKKDQLVLEDIVADKISNRMYLLGDDFLNSMDINTTKVYHLLTPDFLNQNNYHGLSSIQIINPLNAFIISTSKEVYLFNPADNSIHALLASLKTSFIDDGGIQGIVRVDNFTFLVYTKQNLWHVNLRNEILSKTGVNILLKEKKITIVKIIQTARGCFQIILSDGIVTYDLKLNSIFDYSPIDFQTNEKLKLNSFLEDNSGLLWFGTNNGLYKVNPFQDAFSTIDLSTIIDRVENDFITGGCFDKNGKIWIGLNSGRLLFLNTLGTTTKKLAISEKDLNSRINNIICDTSGNIYISTDNGLFVTKNKPEVNGGENSQKLHSILSGQKIYFTAPMNNDSLWIASDMGIYSLNKINELTYKLPELSQKTEGNAIVDFKSDRNYLWIAQAHRVIEFQKRNNVSRIISFPNTNFNGLPFINSIMPIREKELLIGTTDGLYIYYTDINIINAYAPTNISANNYIHAINKDYLGKIWVTTNRGIISHNPTDYQTIEFDANDGLQISNYSNRLTAKAIDGRILFGSRKGITLFSPDSVLFNQKIPNIQFIQATLSEKNNFIVKNIFNNDTLIVEPRYRYIKISFTSLDFWAPSKNKYKYSLEKLGSQEQWVSIDNQNHIIISGLKSGNYKLCIKGSNSEDVWNNKSLELVLHIKAPFLQSQWVTLFIILIALLIFYFTFLYATKQLRKLNREYRERELIAKKVEQQKEELTIKNKNITDSINYAKRIQEALMPSQKIFKKLFPESFILHIPKDIVSGDFYWINEVDGRIYFAAVDCTGHGVPGAFMSIIGFELFRRITETEKKKQPAEILKSLSRGFETFFRDVESYTLRDGMDVAFCAIDRDMMHLEFAGAFNPLYLVRDNSITEIRGDRFSVGLFNFEEANSNKFKSYVIPLYVGDIIYIFTDGFADQFGGPEGKKYKYRRFRHLLLALHQLPMEQQIDFLRRSISDWKGELDQVDDILIMGIRITDQHKPNLNADQSKPSLN